MHTSQHPLKPTPRLKQQSVLLHCLQSQRHLTHSTLQKLPVRLHKMAGSKHCCSDLQQSEIGGQHMPRHLRCSERPSAKLLKCSAEAGLMTTYRTAWQVMRPAGMSAMVLAEITAGCSRTYSAAHADNACVTKTASQPLHTAALQAACSGSCSSPAPAKIAV